MRIGYADPPYFGCCALYEHRHPDGRCWDDLDTHAALIDRLSVEYPDGWALSASSPSLRHLLPLCPEDCRVSPWVKPFASFKPNVNPAYAWEPVIWRGGRTSRARTEPTVRDWHREVITLRRGLTGAKPEGFVIWLLQLLGVQRHDEVIDLFPGTRGVGRAIEYWRDYLDQLPLRPHDLNCVESE